MMAVETYVNDANWQEDLLDFLDDTYDCNDVHHLNLSSSGYCEFVTNTSDCGIEDGFINYTIGLYCTFQDVFSLGMILLVFWWLQLFVMLAVAADDFFCPSLVVIAKTMRMSDNIAGVTLLAFGNGAPDVFSALAAVKNAKDGDIGLAIGALLGAGVFVTTVVAGAVCIVRPFEMMQRPFLRDVIFFIGAVFFTFCILYDGQITLAESIGFLVMYIVYVIIVVAGRYIYQRQKQNGRNVLFNPISNVPEESDYEQVPGDNTPEAQITNAVLYQNAEDDPLLPGRNLCDEPHTSWKKLKVALTPFLIDNWKRARWYKKIYLLFKIPANMVLTITVPIVDYDQPQDGWNRYLHILQTAISPSLGLLLANYEAGLHMIGGIFPVVGIVLIISIVLSVVVKLTSSDDDPPKYQPVFAYLGFIMAVVWISSIANEIVNILGAIGVVLDLSSAILGLTLLAWGNSIGDMIADVAMAKNGFPRAGISACFGGPLFNVLLGIGLPFTIGTASSGGTYLINFTLIQVVLVSSVLFSLIASLILIPLQKFHIGRLYGAFLFVVYLVFIVVAVLVEVGIITGEVKGKRSL